MLFGKHLNKYYKKYIALMLIGVIFLVAVDWFQLMIPEYLGDIVGLFNGESTPDVNLKSDVITICLEVLAVSFGLMIGRILFRVFIFRTSINIGEGLRQEMFDKATRLDVEYFHNQKVGNIMSWMTSDTEEIQEYFGWGTVMIVDGVFMTALCLVKMILLDWIITCILLIPIVLIVIASFIVEKVFSELWMNRQKSLDQIYDITQESFVGIRVIKAFLKERSQLHHFSKAAKKCEKAEVKMSMYAQGYDVILEILIGIAIGLILGVGGYFTYLVATKDSFILFGHQVTLNASKLVVFLSYFTSLIWPLIALGQVITMYSRAKTSLKRISNFLDAPENIVDASDAVTLENPVGKIEFKNLSFSYPGSNRTYLKDITLDIQPGETVGIVGRIGSGKSTIVSLLSRMYNVEEGKLFIDDVDIMKLSLKSLRNSISVVPQENFLFSSTIEGNIKFGAADADENSVVFAANFADIDKDIQGFEKKYDTLTGERGVSLSGGQKQRIAIARAFIKDAPIMIFDDSVSAVDIKTEETIINNIKTLRKGKTTIVVASRISTVNTLDKIIVLNEGELEAFGTPAELLDSSNTYRKMVLLQKIENELKEGE